MGLNLPQVTRDGLARADKALPVANSYFPTADPTKRGDALGRIPDSGVLVFKSNLAATITIKIWCDLDNEWMFPGSASTDYQKTFAGGAVPAFDYFKGPAGAPFHLKSSVANNVGRTNGDAPKGTAFTQ